DHQLLRRSAFDIAQGSRDDYQTRIAIETLMVGQADVFLNLGFLAILVLDLLRGLLSQLHPGALRLSTCSRRGRGSSRCRSCRLCRRRRLLVIGAHRCGEACGESRSQNGA
ncbi:MAG: hypothetical protein ACRETL_17130, partial [Gammaproteobacteria bacterium]